jgi:hypothetical protein
VFFEDQAENNDEDPDQEHKNGDPVDPVHVFYPGTGRFVWISFYDIQIFSNFA